MSTVQAEEGSAELQTTDSTKRPKANNEKRQEEFRVYDEVTSDARVVQHYKDMRTYQTVAFYRKMEKKYTFDNGAYRRLMSIEEALDEVEHYIVRHHGRTKVLTGY